MEAVGARLKKEYAISARWRGETLLFERSGLSGTIHLRPKLVELDVHLGFLLSPFRERIAQAIEQNLDGFFPSPGNANGKKGK
jgi:putative polyhydroxyalkanoate system protein